MNKQRIIATVKMYVRYQVVSSHENKKDLLLCLYGVVYY